MSAMRSDFFSLGAVLLLLATQTAMSGCKTAEIRPHEEDTMMNQALDSKSLSQCSCAREGNKQNTSDNSNCSCGGGSLESNNAETACGCKH